MNDAKDMKKFKVSVSFIDYAFRPLGILCFALGILLSTAVIYGGSEYGLRVTIPLAILLFCLIYVLPPFSKKTEVYVEGEKILLGFWANEDNVKKFRENSYDDFVGSAPRKRIGRHLVFYITKNNVKKVQQIDNTKELKTANRYARYFATNKKKIVLIEFRKPLKNNEYDEKGTASFIFRSKIRPDLDKIYVSLAKPQEFVNYMNSELKRAK